MAKKETIDFTGVSEEIFRRGPKVPPGNHLFKIVKAEKKWKDDDRSNAPYFHWTLQVISKKSKGATMRFITSLKPEALFNLRNLIHAATGKNVAGKSLKFSPEMIYGKKVMGTVEEDEYEDKKSHEMKTRSVLVDVAPADEFTASEKDEDEDEDEEDEEDEDESEDEDEEDESEDEDEDLEEVDLDEL